MANAFLIPSALALNSSEIDPSTMAIGAGYPHAASDISLNQHPQQSLGTLAKSANGANDGTCRIISPTPIEFYSGYYGSFMLRQIIYMAWPGHSDFKTSAADKLERLIIEVPRMLNQSITSTIEERYVFTSSTSSWVQFTVATSLILTASGVYVKIYLLNGTYGGWTASGFSTPVIINGTCTLS